MSETMPAKGGKKKIIIIVSVLLAMAIAAIVCIIIFSNNKSPVRKTSVAEPQKGVKVETFLRTIGFELPNNFVKKSDGKDEKEAVYVKESEQGETEAILVLDAYTSKLYKDPLEAVIDSYTKKLDVTSTVDIKINGTIPGKQIDYNDTMEGYKVKVHGIAFVMGDVTIVMAYTPFDGDFDTFSGIVKSIKSAVDIKAPVKAETYEGVSYEVPQNWEKDKKNDTITYVFYPYGLYIEAVKYGNQNQAGAALKHEITAHQTGSQYIGVKTQTVKVDNYSAEQIKFTLTDSKNGDSYFIQTYLAKDGTVFVFGYTVFKGAGIELKPEIYQSFIDSVRI